VRRLVAVAALLVALQVEAFAADAEAGRVKAEAYVACHGENGNATMRDVPSLAA
jgi:cytochrome c553